MKNNIIFFEVNTIYKKKNNKPWRGLGCQNLLVDIPLKR